MLADLHLGQGGGPKQPAGPPEGSADRLAETVVAAARHERARRVIVIGDVKHPIVGTPPWLRPVVFSFFARLLESGLDPEVVLGNHDVGLVPYLPREVAVHPSTGIVAHGVGLTHGHRWPSPAVRRAPVVVVGHLHPGVRLAPTADLPSPKLRCWVRARRTSSRPARSSEPLGLLAEEVIVVPAFHPLSGTESLNRERPGRNRSFLVARFLGGRVARAYLLDGTDLGVLRTLTTVDRA